MTETILRLREQNEYSQTYLASYLQVSRQMYIKYENGDVEPPVRIIKALCKLYSVPYDFILDDMLSEKKKTEYSINHSSLAVASPAPVSVSISNDSPQLTALISKLRRLPKKTLSSVSAFLQFLQQEEKSAQKFSSAKKSKKAFFELAGNISLDEDSVTAFRQESLI